ncbi:hypothetical protein J2Z53_002553 [Clostridium moniliforme]|uniref:Peptidase M28 domain-containing protein n=1 Tax=Clostridium moniliforme TaxID=39489 RepID=A0ABS4F3T9_9CLOT|nr:M28 family peptidase [Clostridium moniliforme]MBP1890901.1 hypothetical protein [Clostridium moniliforme]
MKTLLKVFFLLILTLSFVSCNISNDKLNKSTSKDENFISKNNDKKIEDNKITQVPNTKEIIEFLCSDEIKSREAGTEGNKKTTKYLEKIFNELDLEYVFNNSYLNTFKYKSENEKIEEASNVVGKISGNNSKKAIILTAHFDAWFNGALDNASGVASTINIANSLKEYSKSNSLNYDIVFCLTNLEMNRFKGSEAFIKDIKDVYDEMFNINIDCIGVNNNKPMAIKNLSKIDISQKLYDLLKETYDEYGVKHMDTFSTPKTRMAFERNQGVSDYISFEKANIPNMQIAQIGIQDYILNENDTPKNLDIDLINKISKSIISLIKKFN